MFTLFVLFESGLFLTSMSSFFPWIVSLTFFSNSVLPPSFFDLLWNDLSHLLQYCLTLVTVASGNCSYTQKGGTSQLDSNRLPWCCLCLKQAWSVCCCFSACLPLHHSLGYEWWIVLVPSCLTGKDQATICNTGIFFFFCQMSLSFKRYHICTALEKGGTDRDHNSLIEGVCIVGYSFNSRPNQRLWIAGGLLLQSCYISQLTLYDLFYGNNQVDYTLANSTSIKRLLASASSSIGSFSLILMRLEMEEMRMLFTHGE